MHYSQIVLGILRLIQNNSHMKICLNGCIDTIDDLPISTNSDTVKASNDELVMAFEISHASKCVSLNCLLFQKNQFSLRKLSDQLSFYYV